TVPYGTSTGPVGVTVAHLNAQGPQFVVRSMVQVTDSASNVTNYTFTMQGGTWHTIASQGSGCSSCTVRASRDRCAWAHDHLQLRRQQQCDLAVRASGYEHQRQLDLHP